MKALHMSKGRKLDSREVAEEAARLEINLLKEPIGKQDQYAAAFGGMNVFQFNADGTVDVSPVHLDYKKRFDLESNIMLFFTGLRRLASSVLSVQKANADKNFETLKQMSDSVYEFEEKLRSGDFKGMGEMLHEGWLRKKTLAANLTNSAIDDFYSAGMDNGAWGGKILGAGGGGCIMLMVPPEKQGEVRAAMEGVAKKHGLEEFSEVPVRFVQAGVEVIANNEHSSDNKNF
jgi:D-glycero-alpha-D-manno-heptose-7-phosphate kinase